MTKAGSEGEIVRLSVGNWIAIVVVVVCAVLGQWALDQRNLATLNTKVETHERRLNNVESRVDGVHELIREEFKAVRKELSEKGS